MKKVLLIIYCFINLSGCAHYDSGYSALGAMLGMDIKSHEEEEEEECYDNGYLSSIDKETTNARKDYFLDYIYKPYDEKGLLPHTDIKFISRLECNNLTKEGIIKRYNELLNYSYQKEVMDKKVKEEAEKLAREKELKKEKEEQELRKYILDIYSISFIDTEDKIRDLFFKAKSYCKTNISRYASGQIMTQLACKNPRGYNYMYYYFVNGRMTSMKN